MRLFYYLFITLVFFSCSKNAELIFDENNAGLFLPQGFQSLVVHDGVGQSRHLAVNDNGDIYVKLRLDYGRNGNVALIHYYLFQKYRILQFFPGDTYYNATASYME